MREKHSNNAGGDRKEDGLSRSDGQRDRPRGIPGDIRRLTAHSAATVGELREFLTKMKGKSPQEIIGAIAQSGLFNALVWSTLVVIVILALGTVGPYSWAKSQAAAPASPAAKPTTVAPAANTAASAPAATNTAANAENTAGQPKTIDPGVAKQLGIDEVKQGTPNSNPFDNNLDDLLDGKKK